MNPSRAIAYPPVWRVVAATLTVISRGSPLLLAALLLFLDEWLGTGLRLGNPLRLLRAFAVCTLAPALLGWLLARAFEARVSIEGGVLVVDQSSRRVEVPCDSIAGVQPWVVPLPRAGVWLLMRSGRRFPYGLQLADPLALAEALVAGGAPATVASVRRSPAGLYARSLPPPRRWYHLLLRYAVFALVPALPLFRLHQWIAYGGTFGEYYVYGLKAYLLGFAIYWTTSAITLVLYAAGLRAVLEPVVFVAAHVAPAWTESARRAVEILIAILYYSAAPAYLLWLYLSS